MSNQFCYHSFNPEEHNGKTWMVCAKCGLQRPLGLFQHWDTERDGPAFKWPPRDKGGKLPAGINYVVNRNSYAYLYEPKIMPKKTVFDRMINAFTAPSKPKRQPIVKVWKQRDGFMAGTWAYDCNLCTISPGGTDWATAYNIADHHARNHHRSK